MRALDFWRTAAGGRFVAVVCAALAVPAGYAGSSPPGSTPTNSPSRTAKDTQGSPTTDAGPSVSVVAPRPAPAYRSDLRPAFTKKAPTSLADLRVMERDVEALAARVSPAVVAVEVGSSSGSGVVISSNGLVLTAGHVCGEAGRRVQFTFPDGRKAVGRTVGLREANDTGLMQITDPGRWPQVDLGELSQTRVGDWVLALGHPGGFDQRRSLVVRLGRIISMDPTALQTDCTISPGDSGGPLFDMHGRVIGIHNAINSSPAGNFHVAISAFYRDWASLVKPPSKKVASAKAPVYVGARWVDDADGCRLTAVEEDGPAARAGLKVGDVVRKVDGREVKYYSSFLRWLSEAEPGETLNLEIKRGEELMSVEVKLEAGSRGH